MRALDRNQLTVPARLALPTVALLPLMPRATVPGIERFMAPAAALLLIYLAFLHAAVRIQMNAPTMVPTVAVILLALTLLYAARVWFAGEPSEYSYVLSRLLLLGMAAAIFYLFRDVPYERVLRAFAVGCVALAVVVALVALTGLDIFGTVRPARDTGFASPWYKTSGLDRSFGEQGILVSILLGFVLVYWRRLRPSTRWILTVSVATLVLAGQSRNMYLATLAVLAGWFIFVSKRRWVANALYMFVAAMATFILEATIATLARIPVVSGFIGEGVYERNVYVRFSLTNTALSLIWNDYRRVLFGISHDDWFDFVGRTAGEESQVHNHFLATLMFFGIALGVATLIALFAVPVILISKQLIAITSGGVAGPPALVIPRTSALLGLTGTLVSLNFYEGFFSTFLALELGLLWILMYQWVSPRVRNRERDGETHALQ